MSSNTGNRKLDDSELSLIEDCSLWLQTAIDTDQVEKLVLMGFKNPDLFEFPPETIDIREHSPEKIAALQIILKREHEEGIFDRSSAYVDSVIATIESGVDILNMHNDYWRFEPCIELIFEMDQNQLDTAYGYFHSFSVSEYSLPIEHQSQSLHEMYREWDHTDTNSENIQLAMDIYKGILTIFERGFPNLLALKRILDGEQPDNDILQKKSASSVRQELTNTKDNINSVYFDLIVGEFDVRLRNSVSHGDILNNAPEKMIELPTNDVRYSIQRLTKSSKAIFRTLFFLLAYLNRSLNGESTHTVWTILTDINFPSFR